jgi:cell division protein ZapA
MDEVSELTRRISALEAELESLTSNRDTALAANARAEETLASVIDEVTTRIHGITEKLLERPGIEQA